MYNIGIDLGGTAIKAAIVDDSGKILIKDKVPTGSERGYEAVMKDMAMLCLSLIGKCGLKISDIRKIGVGCPGTPDKSNGILIYNNNLGMRNVNIRKELQKYINLPVFIDNDANVAALAESISGACRNTKDSVTITLGTGVGSGVVIDGKLYGGFNYAAAELGHHTLIMDGEQCTCGRKGCYEAYASATALIAQTKKAALEHKDSKIWEACKNDLDNVSARTAFEAERMGDKVASMVCDRYIRYIGEGLVNIINIFQPEIIALGGGVCNEGARLLDPLKEYIAKYKYTKEETPASKLVIAELGNDAGVVGAAMLTE
ncbi:MAG: ROK family protein [Clostridia bacterium]